MIKQVIAVRTDLNLNVGQLIAQCCHASMAWLTDRTRADGFEDITETFKGWGLDDVLAEGIQWRAQTLFTDMEMQWVKGPFTKIILQVGSEQELLDLEVAAKAANLHYRFSEESTLGGAVTAIAIGPDEAEKIDPITGHLKTHS